MHDVCDLLVEHLPGDVAERVRHRWIAAAQAGTMAPMVGSFVEDVVRVSSGQLVLTFARGSAALMRPATTNAPLLLDLGSPPGGTLGIQVWAAQSDEYGWEGIERSIRRIYGDGSRSELMDSRTIELAGRECDIVCLVDEFSIWRIVTAVSRLAEGPDAVMFSIHASSRESTCAAFLASPLVSEIVGSLRIEPL